MRATISRFLLRFATAMAAASCAVMAVRFPFVAFLVILVHLWRKSRWRGSGYAHGTASTTSLLELARNGLLSDTGLILGRAGYARMPSRGAAVRVLFSSEFPAETACRLFLAAFLGRRWGDDSLIRLKRFVHLATFAPTGRGKGVSLLVPNLLSYPASCVVTDPKGELFSLTARHRRQRFGHNVVLLDPFHVCGCGSDSLNPLDFLDVTAPDFLDQVRDLANALIVRKGTEHDPHWNDSAELILTAFIAFVAACEVDPDERNLMTVRLLLASREKYARAIQVMQATDAAGGVIRKLGELLTWFVEKEGASVMTTLHRNTAWMDSPAVAAILGRTSFDPRGLRSGRMDIYLCLPPERLASLPSVMRCWIDSLLRVLTRDGASERDPVLFLLDEIGHLGPIQSLENAVTLMRGYGIRLWFFFQSVAQVKDCFGERAGKFLDNIDTQIYFGTNAYDSAEAISKRGGEATILTESFNRNRSQSRSDRPAGPEAGGQMSAGTGITLSEMARPLYRPDEVIRLPEDYGLVFHRNLPVVPVRLLKYYADPEFRDGGMAQPRGLGVAGFAAAAGMLCLSALFVGVMLRATAPVRRARPPVLTGNPVRLQPSAARRSVARPNGSSRSPRLNTPGLRRMRQSTPSSYRIPAARGGGRSGRPFP